MFASHPTRFPTTAHELAQGLTTAQLDSYEAAARGISELVWSMARTLPEPAASFTRACGDLARDVTALQLSSARWILNL
jgi:hypothetical protein